VPHFLAAETANLHIDQAEVMTLSQVRSHCVHLKGHMPTGSAVRVEGLGPIAELAIRFDVDLRAWCYRPPAEPGLHSAPESATSLGEPTEERPDGNQENGDATDRIKEFHK
jgi:hypothetical protein